MEPWAWWELLLYIFPLGIIAGMLLWVQRVRRNARSSPPEGWERNITGSIIEPERLDLPKLLTRPHLSLRAAHGAAQDIKSLSSDELRGCLKDCDRYLAECAEAYGEEAAALAAVGLADDFARRIRKELTRRHGSVD